MNVLVDTNILVRLSDADSPLCPVCNSAVHTADFARFGEITCLDRAAIK